MIYWYTIIFLIQYIVPVVLGVIAAWWTLRKRGKKAAAIVWSVIINLASAYYLVPTAEFPGMINTMDWQIHLGVAIALWLFGALCFSCFPFRPTEQKKKDPFEEPMKWLGKK
jgi:peptidoglycan/LPS O-acetylase OafA/YrhL